MPVTILLLLSSLYLGLAYWLRGRIHGFLVDHNVLLRNYKGEMIPVGYGIYLWVMAMLFGLLHLIWMRTASTGMENTQPTSFMILCCSAVFILGWLDDTIGHSEPKGLTGHLKVLLEEKRWTTGMLKAAGIGFIAIWAALHFNAPWWMIVFQILLISLSSNFINLLDVRPGRAMKGFWLLALVLLAAAYMPGSSGHSIWTILLPFMIGTLFLFPLDLQAKGMLGDAGANLLGFAIGYGAAATSPYWVQLILLALFIMLHWYAERYSLTQTIENIECLRVFDRWGRV